MSLPVLESNSFESTLWQIESSGNKFLRFENALFGRFTTHQNSLYAYQWTADENSAPNIIKFNQSLTEVEALVTIPPLASTENIFLYAIGDYLAVVFVDFNTSSRSTKTYFYNTNTETFFKLDSPLDENNSQSSLLFQPSSPQQVLLNLPAKPAKL